MTKTYTVTLSAAQDKALHTVAYDAQLWIDNAAQDDAELLLKKS